MELEVHVGQVFQTWSDAEKFLTEYSLVKGFSFRRKRVKSSIENEIKVIRKITLCWKISN